MAISPHLRSTVKLVTYVVTLSMLRWVYHSVSHALSARNMEGETDISPQTMKNATTADTTLVKLTTQSRKRMGTLISVGGLMMTPDQLQRTLELDLTVDETNPDD